MAKQLKTLLASQLLGAIRGSEGIVLVSTGPMSVEKATELRAALRKKAGGARLRVIHNRTARAAFKSAGYPEQVATALKGPTAVVYGGESAPSMAKTLVEWMRTDRAFTLKGAVSEGEFFDGKGTQALAKLPDKKTLRAMLCGALLGPARGLAATMAANYGGVARVVQARVDAGGFPADPTPAT